jgi:hypothetical protein
MKLSLAVACGAAVLLVIACSSMGSRCCGSRSGVVYPAASGASVATSEAGGDALAVKAFATPQAAMEAVAAVCGTHDREQVEAIFGQGATEVIWSGDDVADLEASKKVQALIEERVSFEEQSESVTVADLGKDEWPFPIPLVKTASGWKFDLAKGKDELLSRRIGRNELETVDTLYEYVEAQKEYFAKGRDGNPPAYAQKVRSSDAKQDGLYWETAEGEDPSPFGELIAEASKAGYGPSKGDPQPFHGYYYKILTAQGPNGPEGSRNYLDGNGLMTRGFAAIAWPASYGNSGITTFIVNESGIVFEKDLGKDTETVAPTIAVYDPDKSWKPSPRNRDIDE